MRAGARARHAPRTACSALVPGAAPPARDMVADARTRATRRARVDRTRAVERTAAENAIKTNGPKGVVDKEVELVESDGSSLRVKTDLALLGLKKWHLPETACAIERRARLPKFTPAQLADIGALETTASGCPVRRQSQSQWTMCCGSLKARYNEQHMTLHVEVSNPAGETTPLSEHELQLAAKIESFIEGVDRAA